MALPMMPLTGRPLADVAVFGVQKRLGERNRRPWIVRWSLPGRQRSRAFRTKTEADRFRTGLLLAQQSGESFDDVTGEPLSWQPLPDQAQVHQWARRWLSEQWSEWAPRTRRSAVEALSRLIPLAVQTTALPPPEGLRGHLVRWLPPDGDPLDDASAAWLAQWGLQLGQLNRSVLGAVDSELGKRDDGQPLAPSTAGRFRKVSRACIRRAVDLGVLDVDPWPQAPRGRSQRKAARVRRAVSVRSLPDPATMRRAIDAIASHQLASRTYQVMTAVAYYAGLRPSEVVMLRARSLHLPAKGWGRIDVTEADVAFDEPGEPKTGARSVPIPRPLVDMLRSWLDERSLSGDDLLFRTRSGGRRRRRTGRGHSSGACALSSTYQCGSTTAATPPRLPGSVPACRWARSPAAWAIASRPSCRPTSGRSTATRPSPMNASMRCLVWQPSQVVRQLPADNEAVRRFARRRISLWQLAGSRSIPK